MSNQKLIAQLPDCFDTCCGFSSEADSVRHLLSLIPENMFRIYQEVPGQYRGFHQDIDMKTSLRIDLVLSPNGVLFESGYDLGLIGIECKRSNVNIGRPVSQIINYHDTIWTIPGNFQVKLGYIFIWPKDTVFGPIASIMVQNRIGICRPALTQWEKDPLRFCQADGRTILLIREDGSCIFNSVNSGLKIGSR